ncbi:DNL zinc finger-domain-containing protein, partial [Chytriomyces sp. MP71]
RLLIGFNCNKCDHRTHKFMSKQAYETGVVIITCDGCQAKHLIADHLGWFDSVKKEGTIEDIIRRRG